MRGDIYAHCLFYSSSSSVPSVLFMRFSIISIVTVARPCVVSQIAVEKRLIFNHSQCADGWVSVEPKAAEAVDSASVLSVRSAARQLLLPAFTQHATVNPLLQFTWRVLPCVLF